MEDMNAVYMFCYCKHTRDGTAKIGSFFRLWKIISENYCDKLYMILMLGHKFIYYWNRSLKLPRYAVLFGNVGTIQCSEGKGKLRHLHLLAVGRRELVFLIW